MNYNREFLVPYLESICALELVSRDIENIIGQFRGKATQVKLKAERSVKKPEPPVNHTNDGILIPSYILLACGVFFLCLGGVADGLTLWIGIPSLLLGGIGFLMEWPNSEEYKRKKEIYDKELVKYKRDLEAAKKEGASEAQGYSVHINNWQAEKNKINTLLKQAYDANIIPSRYRGLYPSVYLYDYFKTSQSTDLERALTLYVLEEIKTKLDEIIENQSEIIINQQIMIARQQKTYELQQAHAKSMKSRLDNIIASNEERNTYLDMIEANTRATAYFAAAEYLK